MLIKGNKADLVFDIANVTLMLIFAALFIYPIYFVIIASFSDPNLVNTGKVFFTPKGITFLGYRRILENNAIWTGYLNTILYTTLGTTINVVLTITSGYVLSRKDLVGRQAILMVFTFTMFFSGGMIPTYMLVKNLNLTNTIWAMVLPNAMSVWNMMIAKTFFTTTIPDELLDAASIDGCGNLRFFSLIVLPLSKPIVAVMVLFYAVGHWNSFFNALIYLESQSKYPLQLVLRNILLVNQMNDAAMLDDITSIIERQKLAELLKYGIIVVSTIPILMLYPFIQKYFVTGIMIGSIKG